MWNKVSLGFDAEEETVNFGSRQTAVFQKSVYETNTLAIISRDDEETIAANVEKNTGTKISCTKYFGSDPGVVIFIDKSVVILNNDGTELRSSFSFEAQVDCSAVNADGSILFVALNNGDLYCSLLKTSEKPVFLKNICNFNTENEGTFVRMFLHENQEKCIIILIASSGNIYKLTNLNLLEVVKACAGGDKDNIISVMEDTNLEYTSTNKSEYVSCKIILATELERMEDVCILLVTENRDGQELQLWSDDFKLTYYLPLSNRYSLQKLQVTQNGSLIYGLTSQGAGLIICPYTLTLLHHQDNLSIEDFEMMKDDNSLLIFTKNAVSTLQLLSLPDFKMKFQMNINNDCYLAERQSSLDDLMYLEAVTSKEHGDLDEHIIDSIHLKIISESQPEYRLDRILRRGKFDEAEQFARTFNLSVESVYKAHLQKLSLDIQPWNTNNIPIEESGSLFKQLLEKVEDTEFVAQCALNAVSSDFDLMKTTLKYAENRIKSSMSSKEANVNTVFQQLYNKIRNTLLRLNTFFAITEKPLLVDNWLSFHKTNLIQECQNLLKKGQLKEVMLIWGRHIHELKSQLTFDQAVSFFRAIPSSMPISRILDWLRMFLPTVFPLFSKIVANLMAWCKEKINIMELLAEPGWIETGIQFLKETLTMVRSKVKVVFPNVSQSIIESEFAANSCVKDFLFYIKILTELSTMKMKYRINISILEYTHENSEDVIFSILDKVPVEELNSFVKGFFEELVVQKNLNADVVISEYIQGLVEGSVNWWYWEEAPWEGRVSILLSCMNSVQEKLNTVLHVLKNSPVPWSTTVMSICEDALKCENPLTRLIYEQKRMVDCKLVLKRYDLKDIKIIQPHFRRIILFIFQQGRPTMLEDALKIANTFDADLCIEVYKLYVQQLIESGNLTSALSFLDDDNLSPKIIGSCCESIILRVHCLSGMHVFLNMCDNYIEILDTVYSKLTRATSTISSTSYEPVSSVISPGVCEQLKWVRFLRKNYKEDFTIRCFTNYQKREELLQYCLEKNLKSAKEDQKTVKNMNIRLIELASCFSYSTEEIYIRFIRLAMVEEEPNMILYMSRLLLKEEMFQQSVSEQIIDLVGLVLSHCIKKPTYVSDYNLAAFMYQLMIAALNTCPLGCYNFLYFSTLFLIRASIFLKIRLVSQSRIHNVVERVFGKLT